MLIVQASKVEGFKFEAFEGLESAGSKSGV